MPDPIRTGNLKELSFARVYYAIAGQGKTGVLELVDEKDGLLRKRVYFLDGDSCFVQFGPQNETLGAILVEEGVITEDQLEEAIDELALKNQPLGELLVEKGWLSREKLHHYLVYQTELKLVSCFAYQDGNFKFKEETVAEFKHDVPIYKIDPETVVYRGVMKHYSLDRLEKELEPMKEKALALGSEATAKLNGLVLPPEEDDFIKKLSKPAPFAKLLAQSDLGLTRTLKLLYVLLVIGAIEVVPMPSLKSVKVKEKPGVRRKPKVIELEEIEDVETELEQTARQAAEQVSSPSPPAPASESADAFSGSDDFAEAVTDYLAKEIAKEEPAAEMPKGDLVVYDQKEREIEISPLSDILRKNRALAVEAYTSKRPGQGAARLGELLVQNNIIEQAHLNAALEKSREKGTSFLNALVEIGALNDEDLHEFLSEHFKVPAVKLSDMDLDQEVASMLPQDFCVKHKVIPVNRTGNTLVVAMADPTDIAVVDQIKFLTEYNVEVVVATEHEIRQAIDQFHDSADMLDEVMASFDDSDIETATYEDDFDLATIEKDSEAAPVVKLVNQVLIDALNKGASDIHFEPYENAFRIRYRIDGVLYHVLSPPFKLRNAVVSRIKIMSKLDIAERRLPQDGRIALKIGKKKIDFRVSTLPTLWGEKVVLRILDKESLQLDLTKLGMEPQQLEEFRWAMHQPYGMVLVTGPSGSGKTTTLYSALIELNKTTDNISTAEDPVEYYLEGINQVQMHDEIGLNFAYTLRSFLRQDPDIIMVGEVRDFETAEIAIKAALTGHVVLSTVHTNDAPSTINRLLNMGVEPFLITAAVNGVASQRLVRKLCDACKEKEEFDKQHYLAVGVPEEEVDDFVAYRAVGCPACQDRGYKGRIGIYEVMTLKGDLGEFILAGATPSELKREAIRRGMITLRQSGLHKVKEGITTLEEVTRTTMPDFITLRSDFEDVN